MAALRRLAAAALPIALVAACGDEQNPRDAAVPAAPLRVAVELPQIAAAVRTVRVNGGITADRQVTVFSTVAGRVVARQVELGAAVAEGQIIVVVDHAALDLAVSQARSAVATAEEQVRNLTAEYGRVARLHAENGASQQQYDAIRTQKLAAEEGLAQARIGLDQALRARREADVRAPFRGLIGRIHVEVGDMVGPGVPVAVVVNPRPLVARVQVPERDIGLVAIGQQVAVAVAAYPDEAFAGTVRRISPMLDPATRMGEVEVLLPNTDERLRSGMFATVEIEVDRHQDVLTVPSDAVVQETRLGAGYLSGEVTRAYHLFLVRGGRAARVPVELGYTAGSRVEIAAGLAAGDSVIVMGQHLLQDGRPVDPAPVERG